MQFKPCCSRLTVFVNCKQRPPAKCHIGYTPLSPFIVPSVAALVLARVAADL